MLANKKSAQTLVFIAFLALITNPIAKSGFKEGFNTATPTSQAGFYDKYREHIEPPDS